MKHQTAMTLFVFVIGLEIAVGTDDITCDLQITRQWKFVWYFYGKNLGTNCGFSFAPEGFRNHLRGNFSNFRCHFDFKFCSSAYAECRRANQASNAVSYSTQPQLYSQSQPQSPSSSHAIAYSPLPHSPHQQYGRSHSADSPSALEVSSTIESISRHLQQTAGQYVHCKNFYQLRNFGSFCEVLFMGGGWRVGGVWLGNLKVE